MREAQRVALAEGAALTTVLRDITGDDWNLPTDCTEWTVRDLTAHLAAQAEGALNPLVLLRRMRTGARRYPDKTGLDAYTAVQIDEHAGQSGPHLAEIFGRRWPKAVGMMRRTPGLARRISADSGVPAHGKITLGYLNDAVLPRDLLMHRIDLCRALKRPIHWGTHEKTIVDTVLRDVAATWNNPPVTLTLAGPAGGTWTLGNGPAETTVHADAVDYLRTLAGRDPNPHLTTSDENTAALPTLASTRVLF
jgi:uncharacterized protein (TIGR03083 family)